MADTERSIEARLELRYERPALFCPSGRVAVFLALTDLLPPRRRLLMSPIDDDVVALVVLAAGLRPVMGPVDPADGNLDVRAVPESLWETVDGVLTTNLYGLADDADLLRRQCDRHGLVLIEDVAHALVVDDEERRPVGHRGDAVAVSLSKHGRGAGGGALLVHDTDRRAALRHRRDALLRRTGPVSRTRTALGAGLRAGGLHSTLGGLPDRLRGPTRQGHRMAVRPAALRRLLEVAPDLAAADTWVSIDNRRFRERPTGGDLRAAMVALDRADREAAARRTGVELLQDLPALAPGVRRVPTRPLFRVPLLVAERDRAGQAMADGGLPMHYVYDPPLDDMFGPEFVDPSSDPDAARTWAAHVLPVDPLHADRFLQLCAAADGDLLAPLER